MTAPTPAPGALSVEDVKLLKAGDVLRGPDGSLGRYDAPVGDYLIAFQGSNDAFMPKLCAYVGRPDPSGWMPWSGGESPLGDDCSTVVECRFDDGSEGENEACIWDWDSRRAPIAAFRIPSLTPAAGEVETYVDEARALSWPTTKAFVVAATTPTPDRKDDLELVAWRWKRRFEDGPWNVGRAPPLLWDEDKSNVSEPLYGPDAKARIEELEGLLEAAGEYQATFQAQRDAAVKALERIKVLSDPSRRVEMPRHNLDEVYAIASIKREA